MVRSYTELRPAALVCSLALVAQASGYLPYLEDAESQSPGFAVTYQNKQTQPKCTRDSPCYDVTLTYIMDGFCTLDIGPNPESVIELYRKAGLGLGELFAVGRQAAEEIKAKLGFDFTDLPDMAYLTGQATMMNGTVLFSPLILTEDCKLRLTTAQAGEQVQLINKPVLNAAWALAVSQDTRVDGEIKGIMPAGSNLISGHFLTEPCEKGDKKCKSILFPDEPDKPIFIKFTGRQWSLPFQPGNVWPLNLDLEHEDWKEGLARASIVFGSEENPQADASGVLRFPWPLKH